MEEIKRIMQEKISKIADCCHRKETDADFQEEIDRVKNLYKNIKEQLLTMEKDISLYKYKSLCKDSIDYVRQQMKDQKIFMSMPSKFDDLFDSTFVFDIKELDYELASHFQAMFISTLIDKESSCNFIKKDTNKWDDYVEPINTYIDHLIKVCSLSEDCENIPLWYYYADKYKGICLEYSLKEIVNNLRENEYIMPVVYVDNYFKYSPAITGNCEQVRASVQCNTLIKHENWAFEKEWRIIRICDGSAETFTKEIPIKSITFGMEVKEAHKREIMKLSSNKNTEFYEWEKSCYGIRKVKIKRDDYISKGE